MPCHAAHPNPMNPKSRRPWVMALGGLLLVLLYALAARGLPIGTLQDDATHILLAQSLLHGSYSLPDAFGSHPATDPMPGFAFLLAAPVWLAGPCWDLLKLVSLAAAAAALFFFWRLAVRLLGRGRGTSAAALVAVNPWFIAYAGFVTPDMLFMAVSLYLCDAWDTTASTKKLAWLAILASYAALLRPLGFFLPLFLSVSLLQRQGPRRGITFLAAAIGPLSLWTLRNHLLTGSLTRYVDHARYQAAMLSGARAMAGHAGALLASFFGDGLLGLASAPFPVQAALGTAAVFLAGVGARRLLCAQGAPAAFILTASAAALLCVHLDWLAVEPRYILPLLPAAWLLIIAGAESVLRNRVARFSALAVLLALVAPADFAMARAGWRGPARFQPQTMDWIRTQTPSAAVFESLQCHDLILLTGRRSHVPNLGATNRDEWLAFALRSKTGYLHSVSVFPAGGYVSAEAGRLARNLGSWAQASPYVSLVFRDPSEGTAVYRIRHPDPARFLEGWSDYEDASKAFRRRQSPVLVRRKLRLAVAREPNLAHAWAALAQFESSPAQRLADLRHACAADPRDLKLRELLAAELSRTGRRRAGAG